MGFGLIIGFTALSGFFVGLALAAPEEQVEEEVEIAFFELAEEPERELEPEMEELDELDDVVEQTGPRLASLKPPTVIPDGKPKETDPTDRPEGDGYDPYAATGGKGRRGGGKGRGADKGEAKEAPEAEVKKAPPPKPKRQGPQRVTEKTTPPKPISQPYPSHPEDLKAQGIEGVVVMKYVVDVNGNVPTARPVLGPMALAKACWDVMRNWKFEPAKDEDGEPISVTQIARFTFKIEAG
jgi:protein TonB